MRLGISSEASGTVRPTGREFLVVFTPRWITLCFLQNGPELSDPDGLLRGSGRRVRSIRLTSAKDLEKKSIRSLIEEAHSRARVAIEGKRPVVSSSSRSQRTRDQDSRSD